MASKGKQYQIIIIFIFILSCLISQLSGQVSPSMGDCEVFPDDNPWNWDISSHAVHSNSDRFVESIGKDKTLHPDFGTFWNGVPNGIPYTVITNTQAMIPIVYTAYGEESDPGPFPIPLDAPIEGGSNATGDRHVIAVDVDNAMLYELYRAFPKADRWEADSGAKFDLSSNALRPEGWTSADAAGLPIFPGLIRYEEVYIHRQIKHAIRFTVQTTQRKYIWPARHFASASTDPNLPPMGLRFRLKADFDITRFSEPVQVILLALKKHGMIVADNGGNWFLSGAPDERWDDDVLGELKTISGSNFEAILTVDANGDPIYPIGSSIKTNEIQKAGLRVISYPNPFNSSITIKYSLPESCDIRLKIFNLIGHEITTLFEGYQQAGDHELKWTPVGIASGLYLYLFQADEIFSVGKICLQR